MLFTSLQAKWGKYIEEVYKIKLIQPNWRENRTHVNKDITYLYFKLKPGYHLVHKSLIKNHFESYILFTTFFASTHVFSRIFQSGFD